MPARTSSKQRAHKASPSSISEREIVVPVSPAISKHKQRTKRASNESQGRVFTGFFGCMETISGEGTITYSSGDRYDRIPIARCCHIPLRHSFSCRRYNGEFKNGLPEGNGLMTWVSGDMWQGEFQEGLIHGQGTFLSSSDSLPFEYRGGFANGNFEGHGYCRCRDVFEQDFTPCMQILI